MSARLYHWILMRLLISFLLVSATVVSAASDQDEIRALVQRYVDARNHKDATAVRALFTSDADQLVSTGEWRRGLDALLKGAMASSRKESGTSTVTLESVRMIGADTAIADGRYQTSPERKMWSTFVLLRTKAGWRIAAIRNMLPAPPATARK
jgi:uncharacterized protein (TIGR02246 family)